jgi:hypothetical protein
MNKPEEIDFATNILRDLIDPADCWYDHHGYCQAHAWLQEGECPHARGKRWLANFENVMIDAASTSEEGAQ